MTDLLNPKVGVFFITFMPTFIRHGAPAAVFTLGMGAVFVLLTGAYFAVMLAFVQRLLSWLGNERHRRCSGIWANRSRPTPAAPSCVSGDSQRLLRLR